MQNNYFAAAEAMSASQPGTPDTIYIGTHLVGTTLVISTKTPIVKFHIEDFLEPEQWVIEISGSYGNLLRSNVIDEAAKVISSANIYSEIEDIPIEWHEKLTKLLKPVIDYHLRLIAGE